jgi:LuxR family transcriptional regulator, maltose regulon positive regulatory protein
LQQFRGIRLMAQGVGQYRTLLSAQIGDLDTVDRLAMALFASLNHPELEAHRAAWGRAHRHAHARTAWVHDDHARWQRLAESLGEPRTAAEWPFLDVAARVVVGQRAIVAEHWPTAIANLKESSRDYPRMRMPMIYCDPRISLAYAHLASGDPNSAWQEFEPVLEEAQRFRAVGGLLFDSRKHVTQLLHSLPEAVASKPEVRALREVLARWWIADQDAPKQSVGATGSRASVLSEREREVLELVASGASNKIVARKLDLSLHTVKRHICNILDKLDCDSRGQASDWWRRASAS